MFQSAKILTAILSIFLVSCSDYNLNMHREDMKPGVVSPEIEVDPLSYSFGALSAGSETQSAVINIKNIGNGDLDLHSIFLDSNSISNFSIISIPGSVIESLGSGEVVVEYSPGTYETNTDSIVILSNDEDEPETIIYLDGSGDAPVITITPNYYDFGTEFVGCETTLEVEIGNIGNSALILTDIEYFASMPSDFHLYEFESYLGQLPVSILPGDNIKLDIEYAPMDVLDDSAFIEVTSNDPASPIVFSDHDGLGDYESWINDSFTQDSLVDVDILFVIDNSGSMGSNQTNIKNNFDTFMNAFTAAGISYNVALITTDSQDFVGPVISTATPDPVSEFNDQIDSIGTRGSAQETGLWTAYQSTTAGDASATSATGFFRSSARLVVVYVSDEPDWSIWRDSSLTPSDYSASLLSLKSSPSLVVAHAIAGDYPSGCSANGGAQFGDGYYDVVNDLGGTFMSICASDWSVTMDTLARDSMSMVSFPLSDVPIEDTISINVDGSTTYDWVYDTIENTVTFTVAPAEGSAIDISYAVLAECAQ